MQADLGLSEFLEALRGCLAVEVSNPLERSCSYTSGLQKAGLRAECPLGAHPPHHPRPPRSRVPSRSCVPGLTTGHAGR